jgi:hypothetical protein
LGVFAVFPMRGSDIGLDSGGFSPSPLEGDESTPDYATWALIA